MRSDDEKFSRDASLGQVMSWDTVRRLAPRPAPPASTPFLNDITHDEDLALVNDLYRPDPPRQPPESVGPHELPPPPPDAWPPDQTRGPGSRGTPRAPDPVPYGANQTDLRPRQVELSV